MFFERDILLFDILDVFELNQENISMFNSGRNFSAISFRFCSDTVLKSAEAEYHVKDNYVCYVPARLDYSRVSKKDCLIVVHFDVTNYSTRNIECFAAHNPDVFGDLFRSILNCWNKKQTGYKYRCASILYDIFGECYMQNYKQEVQKSKIRPSVEYMLQNYKNSALSIKEIADRSFMSEVYFRKLFKREYGVSPQKYIINLRIQNAVGLISTGYYSLKEVAYMSGYNDYKYFSVEFKKAIGVSPSEYLYNYSEPFCQAADELSGITRLKSENDLLKVCQ